MSCVKDFVHIAFRIKGDSFLPILETIFKPIDTDQSREKVRKTIRPQLIKSYGLEELAVLIPNLDFPKAMEWQRLRGTTGSLVIALEMLGAQVDRIQELRGERWNFYKVRIKKIPEGVSNETLVALCRLSAPLRSRLFRLSDINETPSLRLSTKNGTIGKNLISNYSGEKVKGVWSHKWD